MAEYGEYRQMNERIKQLAEQALRDATDNGFSDRVYRPDGYATAAPKAFADRFAELIIKECCTQINAQDDGASLDSWDRGFVAGLRCANRAITEYFGVEE